MEIELGRLDLGIGRPGVGDKTIAIRRSTTLAVAGVLLLAAAVQVPVRVELCNVKTFSLELEKLHRLRRCRRRRGHCRRLRRRHPHRFRRHRRAVS